MVDGVKTQMIELSQISVPSDRMRKPRPEVADSLAESIREQGLLHPIIVRPRQNGFTLVVGRHRLMAVKKLKHKTIRCEIREGLKVDAAQLAEIDENLMRADLSPAEQAAHHATRKELYEKLYPETKQGGNPGKSGGGKKAKNDKLSSFAEDTARKTGVNRRTVERSVARGRKISSVTELAGTSLDKGDELDALAKLEDIDSKAADTLKKQAAAGKKVSAKAILKRLKREAKEKDLGARQMADPEGKYGVILADPEWRFEPYSRETGMDRAADNHYPTSVTEDIAARDVSKISDKDCVLFLWATVPMLKDALQVLEAWGFKYVSQYIWDKTDSGIGTGYWNRNIHEILLIGTKGSPPPPAQGKQWKSIIREKPTKHSRKPRLSYEMIEAYYPNMRKIELNAREARPGWDVLGNEAPVAEAAE